MKEYPSYDWGNMNSPWIKTDLNAWGPLIEGRIPVRFESGQDIFWSGKEFGYIYIVASGRAVVSLVSEGGGEKQLYIACPGAMFGEVDCILSSTHVAVARSIVRSELYCIPSRNAQEIMHEDSAVTERMIQYEALKCRILMNHISMLSFDEASVRIAKILLCLAETYGISGPEGILIDMRFTCTDMAGIVGTSRVTVNNTLRRFAREGLLEKQVNHYLIRKPALLRKYAQADE